MLPTGTRIEIKPGFSSESHMCDVWDEVAGSEAYVIRDDGRADVEVEIKGTGAIYWINRTRIKDLTVW